MQLLAKARQMDPVRRARTLMAVAIDNRLAAIAQAVRSAMDGEEGRWAALVLEERFSLAAPRQTPPQPPTPQLAGPEKTAPPMPKEPEGAMRGVEPTVGESEEAPPAALEPETPAPAPSPQPEPQPAPQRGDTQLGAAPQPEAPAGPAQQAPAVRIEGVRAAVARALGSLPKRPPRGPVQLHRELDDLLALRDLNGLEEQLIYLSKLLLMYLMGELDLSTARELGEDYGSRIKELAARGHRVREEIAAKAAEAARMVEERQEVRDLALLASLAAQPSGRVEDARAWSSSSS
jgi:predicted transcriptional regulator